MDQDQSKKLINLGYKIYNTLWWVGVSLVVLDSMVVLAVIKAVSN